MIITQVYWKRFKHIVYNDDMSFEIAFDIKCTMIDGKVCWRW